MGRGRCDHKSGRSSALQTPLGDEDFLGSNASGTCRNGRRWMEPGDHLLDLLEDLEVIRE